MDNTFCKKQVAYGGETVCGIDNKPCSDARKCRLTIYCMWNDTTRTVILKQTTWDKVKDISCTGVKKFKPTQEILAKSFARTKKEMYARANNS